MAVEKSYRPVTLADFKGQEKTKRLLEIYIKAAKMKNEQLDHVLISGPSGTGKTTLAHIIGNELEKEVKVYSAPTIKKVDELVDILSSVDSGTVLFIDEVHRLNNKLSEALFLAMETFTVNSNLEGIQEKLNLPHFTVIGATTNLGDMPEAMINRFQIKIALQPYNSNQMADIIKQSYAAMGVDIDNECAEMIAGTSRGVPRIANSHLRRVYDFALVLNDGIITKEIIEESFEVMGVNKYGLNQMDVDYLSYLHKACKAVGVDSIAMALNTDKKTLENNVEPYLVQCGYIYKSPRGRMISEKGKEVLWSE